MANKLKHPCVYCKDPILDFQEAYHKGCAEIEMENRLKPLRKRIKALKKHIAILGEQQRTDGI